ncbi:hypothetical protein B0T24DRAFT_713047 [Lasiosphaeria ovina]|uniref:RING-type domain-containing protein n=1 Tax=Lasiosphaeria ovina TaxID=92902 RepID=A0AAE0N050_9PEZI|nr:hypothetical protein B0T24DRAFT_713047 [Lasiosphaeria ovina]
MGNPARVQRPGASIYRKRSSPTYTPEQSYAPPQSRPAYSLPSSPRHISFRPSTPPSLPNYDYTTPQPCTSPNTLDTDSQILCSSCQLPTPRRDAPTLQPCGHATCRACVRARLLAAFRTRPFAPPACCGPATPLPLALLGAVATEPELLAYHMKLSEMKTAPTNRAYCCDPACRMYLYPALERRPYSRTCPRCLRRTCLRLARIWAILRPI